MVFATVAFGEGAMYRALGLYGSYAVWTLLLILPAGLALKGLLGDPTRRRTFPFLFGAAFFLYAAGWMVGYFLLRKSWGEHSAEVVASLLGSGLLAATLAAGLGSAQKFGRLLLILFPASTIGYFLGGALYFALGRPAGMLLWGVAYGVTLGAGLGVGIKITDCQSPSTSDEITPSG